MTTPAEATRLYRGVLAWLTFNARPEEVIAAARAVVRHGRSEGVDGSWARAWEFEAALELGRGALAWRLMREELHHRYPRHAAEPASTRALELPDFVATWERPAATLARRARRVEALRAFAAPAFRRPAWAQLPRVGAVTGPELRRAFSWFPPARASEQNARDARDLAIECSERLGSTQAAMRDLGREWIRAVADAIDPLHVVINRAVFDHPSLELTKEAWGASANASVAPATRAEVRSVLREVAVKWRRLRRLAPRLTEQLRFSTRRLDALV
ncbi:MAG: hypothetical protein U0228_16680 [Myxococcaceae bacterium]